MTSGSSFSIHRVAKYWFSILLAGWIIISMSIMYQFVLYASTSTDSKGWTLVQWVEKSVSYLPYVQADDEWFTYRSLLFDSCLNYSRSWDFYSLQNNVCEVSSTDNKEFTIKVLSGIKRSDGVSLTTDDVFFTLNDVIRNNKRNLSSVEQYNNIIVVRTPEWTIKVTFPIPSVDNALLFTQPILPQHTLWDKKLQYYKSTFSSNPVGSQCGRLDTNTKDSTSLLFNLSACDTSVAYYQIKGFSGQTSLISYTSSAPNNIIDFMSLNKSIDGYRQLPINTNTYMVLFFNTQSTNLTPIMRRSLGWLISNKRFGTWNLTRWFLKKDTYIFGSIPWTGSEIANVFDQQSVSNQQQAPATTTISFNDIQRLKIPKLPSELRIQWRNKRAVYYINDTSIPNNIKFTFASTYDKMTIAGNDGKEQTLQLIDKPNRVSFFNISKDTNLKEWLNKYTIRWYRDNTPRLLLTMDVYQIKSTQDSAQSEEKPEETKPPSQQIRLIVLKNDQTNIIVKQLQNILISAGIDEYIEIQEFDNASEFEGKILSKDYDMVIRPLDRGSKKDISSLLLTDKPLVNPSMYTNSQMASYIQQYLTTNVTDTSRTNILQELQIQYQRNIPFLLLWRMTDRINIKSWNMINWSGTINRSNLMNEILDRVRISKTVISIDRNKLLNRNVFRWFVYSSRLGNATQTVDAQE